MVVSVLWLRIKWLPHVESVCGVLLLLVIGVHVLHVGRRLVVLVGAAINLNKRCSILHQLNARQSKTVNYRLLAHLNLHPAQLLLLVVVRPNSIISD